MSLRRIDVLRAGDSLEAESFDLALTTLGYERRSSFVARAHPAIAPERISLAFPEEQYASYAENKAALISLGQKIVPFDRASLPHILERAWAQTARCTAVDTLRVLIDISSMDRPLIARTVHSLHSATGSFDIDVTFVYCPAEYVAPDHEHAPVAVSKPVIPEYAGWTTFPSRSVTAIVGAGYERDLALGALEFLEPAAAWAFFPTGEDERYDRSVEAANRPLREILPDGNIFTYNVKDPLNCFTHLEGLVYGLTQNSRPILLPFGPKVFFLNCILVASIHSPSVTVWRVSGESSFRPGDRVESGNLVTMHVRFAANT